MTDNRTTKTFVALTENEMPIIRVSAIDSADAFRQIAEELDKPGRGAYREAWIKGMHTIRELTE